MNIFEVKKKLFLFFRSTSFKFEKLFIFKIKFNNCEREINKYKITRANSIADLSEIIYERKGGFEKMYKNWLSKNFICFIASEENETIGVVWLNNTNEVPLEFGYNQKLINKSDAGLIDAYVLENKRGKGVYKDIWNNALKEAKLMGIHNLYGYIVNTNIRSMKVHYKLRMKDVYQIIYYIRILWFNFYFTKTYKDLVPISTLMRDIKFE